MKTLVNKNIAGTVSLPLSRHCHQCAERSSSAVSSPMTSCHWVQFCISLVSDMCPRLVSSSVFLHYFIVPLLNFFSASLSFFVSDTKPFYFLITMGASTVNNNHSFKRSFYNVFENPASLNSCLKRLAEV